MKIGKIIAKYRIAKKITQRDLADRLDCSLTAVGQWEASMRIPSVRNRLKISEVLGIPVSELMPEFAGEPGLSILVTDPKQIELINAIRKLPPQTQEAILLIAKAMARNPQANHVASQSTLVPAHSQ